MRSFQFICLLFIFKLAYSQDTLDINNPKDLYSSLQNLSGNSYFLSEQTQQSILRSSPILSNYNVSLIIKKNNLFLFPENGSGRIISLDSSGIFTRFDNTQYGGDRFGAFTFIYNDTIYSIGGYGFWHVNGAIRFFDPYTKDWTPIYINKNIQCASTINAFFVYNEKQAKVYVINSQYSDEYLLKDTLTKSKQPLYVNIFDLKTKKWQNETLQISPNLANNFSDLSLIASTQQYLIVNSKLHNQTLALDLYRNEVLELNSSFINAYLQLKDTHPFRIYSQNDSCLFFKDLVNQEIYTQNIKSLIKKKLFTLYTKYEEPVPFPFLWLSMSLNAVLIILLLFISVKNHKQNQARSKHEELDNLMNPAKHKGFLDLLNDVEQQIVLAIAEDFKAGRFTSIDKINKILDIEKRPYKIKNNLRADVLKMINKKFMDYLGNDDELIIRNRSEFDKRFFEYTINERYVNKINVKKEMNAVT